MLLAVLLSVASMVPVLSYPGSSTEGAGILIQPQLVVTALHVVGQPVMAVRCGGDEIEAHLVARAASVDLALLELSQPCGQPVSKLAGSNPDLGTIVYAEGCPHNTCGWRLYGHMAGYDFSTGTNDEPFRVLVSEAPIWFGSSGGPLYNEKREVVGISQAIRTFGEGSQTKQVYALFIPVETISAFLAEVTHAITPHN